MVALGLKNGGGNSRPGAVLGMKSGGGQSHSLGHKTPGMFWGGVVDSARSTVEDAAAKMAADAVDKAAAKSPVPVPKSLKRKAKQVAAAQARKAIKSAV